MSQQSPNQLLTLPGSGGSGNAGNLPPAALPWWRRPRVIIGIAIALLILIIGALLLGLLNRKPPATYQQQQVTQGDLSLTINATGPIKSSVYNVIFQGTGGKVAEVDVKEGQKVTKGQLLARLDKTSLQDAYNSAQANLDSAKLGLNSALANAGAAANQVNTTVNANRTAVGVAQNNQGASNGVSNANVSNAQTTLDNARNNLDAVQRSSDAQKSQAEAQRQQDLKNCETSGSATGSVGSGSIVGEILTPFLNLTTSPTAVSPTSTQASTQSQQTQSAATPAPTPTPDPQKVENCKQLAEQKYNATVATADANVTTAQNQVNTAETGLTQAEATGNQTNTTAAGQVTTAQSNVDTSKASTSATTAEGQVMTAEGQLAVAVANLATAQHNLDNADLTAPHDGTVTVVNATVGGQPGVATSSASTSSGTGNAAPNGTVVQIVDLNSLQVQANVNESDTGNLKVGDPATFTVNAYGNRQFNGTVSGVSPNGVTVSNVVTYPVYIDVDINSAKGANLLPNMTANATITVVQRKNVPQISVNAINFARLASSGSTAGNTPQLITRQEANTALSKARQMLGDLENQNPSVAQDSPIPAYVIQRPGGGDVFTARPVVLGLTDGTNYEVLEGLSPGETYIVGSGNSTRPGATASGANG